MEVNQDQQLDSRFLPFKNMSTRLGNTLRKNNIFTYSDLKKHLSGDFLKFRGCGSRFLAEVKLLLANHGKTLSSEENPSEVISGYQLARLTMRNKVITAMILANESYKYVGKIHCIYHQRVFQIVDKTKHIFLFNNCSTTELKKNPDDFLKKLFDFPSS
ncbi:MAG: hypothetical protein MUO63_01685 [Desulfobulbaceae bacterium]|nr:hypothetical protein [Desulfobulbaceae bacterium]